VWEPGFVGRERQRQDNGCNLFLIEYIYIYRLISYMMCHLTCSGLMFLDLLSRLNYNLSIIMVVVCCCLLVSSA